MSKKIVGVTVGTTISPKLLEKKLKPVKSVNGMTPDENGNVEINEAPPIECNSTGEVIAVNDSAERPLRGLSLYGKTIQNGTPTPESPVPLETVGADGSVDVQIANSNLMPFPYHNKDGTTANGLTFNIQPDGSVIVNGTATAETFFTLTSILYLPKGKYTFSGVSSGTYGGSLRPQLWCRNTDTTHKFGVYAEGKTIEVTKADYYSISIDIVEGNTLNNFVVKPMINVGDTALPFESPIGRKTLTVNTPNGLLGIPVATGGNYTDENGQMWICDEIDFARGKYVQRIAQIVLDGDENTGVEISNGYSRFYFSMVANKWHAVHQNRRFQVLSNHFVSDNSSPYDYGRCWITIDGYLVLYVNESMQDYGTTAFKTWLAENPVAVQYIMATPMETDLTAEEIAQYSVLHTNYPNTTIFNAGGANMEVKYVADTKLYIDKKFAELASAIVSNT